MLFCRFVNVHYELVPYLLTTGTEAYENQRSSITPLAKHDSIVDKVRLQGPLCHSVWQHAVLTIIQVSLICVKQ